MGLRDKISPDSFLGLYVTDPIGQFASYIGMLMLMGNGLNPIMAAEMTALSTLITGTYEGICGMLQAG
ncbi:MAG: hypothetical protein QXJ06_00260 [Candidatus Aenigmatarchaeota archaeon]